MRTPSFHAGTWVPLNSWSAEGREAAPSTSTDQGDSGRARGGWADMRVSVQPMCPRVRVVCTYTHARELPNTTTFMQVRQCVRLRG